MMGISGDEKGIDPMKLWEGADHLTSGAALESGVPGRLEVRHTIVLSATFSDPHFWNKVQAKENSCPRSGVFMEMAFNTVRVLVTPAPFKEYPGFSALCSLSSVLPLDYVPTVLQLQQAFASFFHASPQPAVVESLLFRLPTSVSFLIFKVGSNLVS